MNIRLLELDGNIVKPTEHCYMISWLKAIIDEYPDDYIKVLSYVYYMSNLGPDNPFFNIPEVDRETKILKSIQPEFDTDDPIIQRAVDNCMELYTTPTMESYQAIKTMLENLNDYLKTTTIKDGRDGNITALLRVAKEFDSVRKSFKGVHEDLQEETKVQARGGVKLPYDLK